MRSDICTTNKFVWLLMVLLASTSCSKRESTKTILLLAQQEHFGLYTGEMLRTEGFNHFVLDSITDHTTRDFLKDFDVVILTQSVISPKQAEVLTAYVEEGGSLIAFRPAKIISTLFGIKDISGVFDAGHIMISGGNEIGRGLITNALQVHGEADRYMGDEARTVVMMTGKVDTAASSPGIIFNHYGKGLAMAFAYNLPESIVYSRQGNPANAGLEKDGILGIRAMDLFTHRFVDTSNNRLNQADEQMRILTRGIERVSLHSKPLPRFWYFPDSLKCVVTLNNDGEDSREAEFLKQFDDVEKRGATMTLYVKEPQLISKDRVQNWTQRGFEISGHPDDTKQAIKPDWNTMDSVYADLQQRLHSHFGISAMKTITNHWFVWVGSNEDGSANFAAQAKLEAMHGVGLDCNYAHYDNGSDQGHFLGPMGYDQGNYTGSGLTMKFANGDGAILNIYQQLNNVYDQQYMEHRDQDGYYNAFRGIMDRSLNQEVYSTISVRAHNNEYFFSEIPLMKMLEYAKTRNVPVWTELNWLRFLEAKDASSFENMGWTGSHLTFDVRSQIAFERSLTVLIPHQFNQNIVKEISAAYKPLRYDVVTIKGVAYARIFCEAGTDTHVEVSYE